MKKSKKYLQTIKKFETVTNEIMARHLFESLNIDASKYFRNTYKKTSHLFKEYHILTNSNNRNDCWTTWYISDLTEIHKKGQSFFEDMAISEMLHLHSNEYFWAINHYNEVLDGIKERIDKYMKEVDK